MAEPPGAASAQRITKAAFEAWLDGKSPSIRSSPRAKSLLAGKSEMDSEEESYSGISGLAGPDDESSPDLPSQPHRNPAPALQVPQLGQAVAAVPSSANPESRHAVTESSTDLSPASSTQGISISGAAQQLVSKPTQSLVPARESADRRLKGNYRNITELHCTVNPACIDIKLPMEVQGATRPDQHGSAVPRKAAVGTPNPVMRPPKASKTSMAAPRLRQGTKGPDQHSCATPAAGLRMAAGVAPNPVSHSPSNGKISLAAQGVSMPTYASKGPMAPQRANHTDQQAMSGPGKDAGGVPSQAVDAPLQIFIGQDDSAHSGGSTHEVHLHLPSLAWSV